MAHAADPIPQTATIGNGAFGPSLTIPAKTKRAWLTFDQVMDGITFTARINGSHLDTILGPIFWEPTPGDALPKGGYATAQTVEFQGNAAGLTGTLWTVPGTD